ncbi:hypothetical protein ACXIUS_05615 [Bosea thiooxidans]|nr:hypothetical protein [Bosea sp. (in: a-proteobacteria)]
MLEIFCFLRGEAGQAYFELLQHALIGLIGFVAIRAGGNMVGFGERVFDAVLGVRKGEGNKLPQQILPHPDHFKLRGAMGVVDDEPVV